jgi:hypothetical protein
VSGGYLPPDASLSEQTEDDGRWTPAAAAMFCVIVIFAVVIALMVLDVAGVI